MFIIYVDQMTSTEIPIPVLCATRSVNSGTSESLIDAGRQLILKAANAYEGDMLMLIWASWMRNYRQMDQHSSAQ